MNLGRTLWVSVSAAAIVCGGVTGCGLVAEVVEPGTLVVSQRTVNLPRTEGVWVGTPHLALTVETESGDLSANEGEYYGFPDGLRAPAGHEVYRIALSREIAPYAGGQAKVELLAGDTTFSLDGKLLGKDDDGTVATERTPPEFAVAVPLGEPLQLKVTDEGRELLVELRGGSVQEDGTTMPDCQRGRRLEVSPPAVKSVVPLRASGVADVPVTLGWDEPRESADRTSRPVAGLQGWTPGQGWAPDGTCWLVLAGATLSAGSVDSVASTEQLVVDLTQSITVTPDGQSASHPEGAGRASLDLAASSETELEPIVVPVAADSRSASLVFAPRVVGGIHATQEATPATATLSY